jgi:NDP-sugar pyrophosphorylase family protein
VSATLLLMGKTCVVVATDGLSQQDAVRIELRDTEEAREFVKLAGTIQSDDQQASRMHVVKNLERMFYVKSSPEKPKSTRIVRPPGSRLVSLADFFCSPKTLERVIRPAIADLQHEYCQALAENRKDKAIWVCIRGYFSFWIALGLRPLLKNLAEIWKASRLGS